MRRDSKFPPTGRWKLVISLAALLSSGSAVADNLPAGFQETAAFGGSTFPAVSAVRFAPDGRVFVAERSGIVKVFDDIDDPTSTVFADLSTNVYNAWDRGLLGLALHPQFPAVPYVYVLYTHDALVGGTAPLWDDQCPDPPGFTNEGCVVSSRLSRLEATGDVMTGSELVLIEGWCQQYPGHSVGDLHFGSDGALYMSHGDGASFNFPDYGQVGNPCGDPSDEGGALRSQDLQTAGDPVNLHGAILRLDPLTGGALPGNPLFGGAESGDDRIIAYGLRNPFRFTIRPQSEELWISDVGWGGWEELNRIADPNDALVENFGWPCFEGFAAQPGYDAVDLPICENLYAGGTVAPPHHAYPHGNPSGSAITGLAFYGGGAYPPSYDGALFFADYSEAWIRVMFPDLGGDPDPANIALFATNVTPVDLQIGPSGDLFYVNYQVGGPSEVRRVQYFPANQPPVAVLQADPTSGPAPLTVDFDGSGSFDPDPNGTIAFDWDLDGDGAFGDANASVLQHTYLVAGTRLARLRVTDNLGASTTASVLISTDNAPPVPIITAPTAATTWRVGDSISLIGSASDPDTGVLPPTALDWEVILHHCQLLDPNDPNGTGVGCHTHAVQAYEGVATADFTAIDHEFPSYLEVLLTASDDGAPDWWDSTWTYRQRLTLDNNSQAETLLDFPVLVRLTPPRTDYANMVADGADLRFVDALGVPLDYEIEHWNPAGESLVWVKVAEIAGASASDFLWLYFGNPAALDGQSPSAVWSDDFAAVWHLNDPGSGDPPPPFDIFDAGPGANHGVNAGATAVPGRVSGGRHFTGGAYIDVASPPGVMLTGALTLESWVQVSDPDDGSYRRIFSKKNGWDGPAGYELEYNAGLNFLTLLGGGNNYGRAESVDLDTGWHHLAGTISGGTARVFVDGIDVTTDSTIGPLVADAQALHLGRHSAGGSDHFEGGLDEMRVSAVARSADWIAAQYASMTDTLVSYGPVEDRGVLSATASVTIQPETVQLTLDSDPPGLQLVIYGESEEAPQAHEVIVNAVTTVSAPSPQVLNGDRFEFVAWSDGGARSHGIVIPDAPQTLLASFVEGCGPACDVGNGDTDVDGDCDVDITDLGIVLSNFGTSGAGLAGDVDNDGDVDISDLGALLANFGTTCP